MPPCGNGFPFVFEHIERLDQAGSGIFRKNNLINIPQFSSFERAGEVVSIIINQLLPFGFGIFRFGNLLSEDDIDGPLRTHNSDFSGGVGIVDVPPVVLAAHDVVGTAVGLSGHHGDFGHRGLAVGVDDFGPVFNDATVLLAYTRQKTRNINKGYQRNVEGITGSHKPSTFHGGVDVQASCHILGLVRHNSHGHAV